MRSMKACAVLLSVATVTTVSGCSEPPAPVGVTVLLVGNHANAPTPALTRPVESALQAAQARGDTLLVQTVEGTPKVVGQLPLGCAAAEKSSAACEQHQQSAKETWARLLVGSPATTPQTSLFTALSVARAQAPNYGTGGPVHIIALDPGLDTTGPMAVPDLSLLSINPSAAAASLKKQLPDLKGISVELLGIGAVAAPQKLSNQQGGQLRQYWSAILAAAGATTVDVTGSGASDQTAARPLPPVRVVLAPKPGPNTTCATVKLDESQLGFLPDQAVLRDPTRVPSQLQAFADRLKPTPYSVAVIGTTAYPEITKGPNSLSNRRARVVVNMLEKLGIPGNRLMPQGVGINFSDYKDPQGNPFLEVSMRRVILRPICP